MIQRVLLLPALVLLALFTFSVVSLGDAGPKVTQAQPLLCVEPDFVPRAISPAQQQIPDCIVVIKDTKPEGEGGQFSFLVDSTEVTFNFSLADDEEQQIPVPGPGDYTIIEDEPGGWDLEITCEGQGIEAIEVTDTSVTITFGGEALTFSAVCIFENDSGEDEDEEEPTATPTRTPTRTPTPTATATPVGPNLGGLDFPLARRDTPTPTAPGSQTAPSPGSTQTVRPPSTGNAGLQGP